MTVFRRFFGIQNAQNCISGPGFFVFGFFRAEKKDGLKPSFFSAAAYARSSRRSVKRRIPPAKTVDTISHIAARAMSTYTMIAPTERLP